jgi:hypothetical protein
MKKCIDTRKNDLTQGILQGQTASIERSRNAFARHTGLMGY